MATSRMLPLPALFISALLALALGAGCALPMEGAEAAAAMDIEDTTDWATGEGDIEFGYQRIIGEHETVFEEAPLEFTFIVAANEPQVVLGSFDFADAWSTGEPTWAAPPWQTGELLVRRDVDVHRVPVHILTRLGEAFVSEDALTGEPCVGYLGELSVLRAVREYNLPDLMEGQVDDETAAVLEAEDYYDEHYIGPPTDQLGDARVIWDAAERRTYLTATFETVDGCQPRGFGTHPEYGATDYRRVDGAEFESAAHALFRQHPGYADAQRDHDESYEDYPYDDLGRAGIPFDREAFEAHAFRADDGRRLVIAAADSGNACGGYGGRLAILFDVTDDGALVERGAINLFPDEDLLSLLETADGALHYRGSDQIFEVLAGAHDGYGRYFSIQSVEIGCGC